jgi:hypothetical protein
MYNALIPLGSWSRCDLSSDSSHPVLAHLIAAFSAQTPPHPLFSSRAHDPMASPSDSVHPHGLFHFSESP